MVVVAGRERDLAGAVWIRVPVPWALRPCAQGRIPSLSLPPEGCLIGLLPTLAETSPLLGSITLMILPSGEPHSRAKGLTEARQPVKGHAVGTGSKPPSPCHLGALQSLGALGKLCKRPVWRDGPATAYLP